MVYRARELAPFTASANSECSPNSQTAFAFMHFLRDQQELNPYLACVIVRAA